MESLTPPLQSKRRPVADINVVPYIDVMLVLLIIFMITAPMLVQSVPVNLPEVDSQPSNIDPDENTLIITVNDRGLYYLERNKDTPEAMILSDIISYAQKVKAEVPETRIMIRGDQMVAYGKVVELMGGLQDAGIYNLGLITEAPDPTAR